MRAVVNYTTQAVMVIDTETDLHAYLLSVLISDMSDIGLLSWVSMRPSWTNGVECLNGALAFLVGEPVSPSVAGVVTSDWV